MPDGVTDEMWGVRQLYKYRPPLQNPPKDPGDDRQYWQYALVATEDVEYEVVERGVANTGRTIHLKQGEVWKYGTTVNPTRRYTLTWLRTHKLRMKKELKGTRSQVLFWERLKIMLYKFLHGNLPPGNKIIG